LLLLQSLKKSIILDQCFPAFYDNRTRLNWNLLRGTATQPNHILLS